MRMKKEKGYSLVELMIAFAIISGFAMIYYRATAINNDEIRTRPIVEEAAQFQKAAINYFAAFRNEILKAADDGTGADTVCIVNYDATGQTGEVVNNVDKHTCMADVTYLKHKGYLPASFPDTNFYGQQWVAIYKRIYDENDKPTKHAEMLTVAAQTVGSRNNAAQSLPVESTSLNKLMLANGGTLGAVRSSTFAECSWNINQLSTSYICGASGAWRVKASDFLE